VLNKKRLYITAIIVLVLGLSAYFLLIEFNLFSEKIKCHRITNRAFLSELNSDEGEYQERQLYVSDRWVRQNMSRDVAVIYDSVTDGVMYVNYEKEEYAVLDLDSIEKKVSSVSGMFGEFESGLEKTDETKRIGRWNTRIYKLSLNAIQFKMKVDLYVAEDIRLPEVYDTFQVKWKAFQGLFKNLTDELLKIKGYPVKSEGKMFFAENYKLVRNDVIEYSRQDVSKSLFEIPGDFREVPFNIFMLRDDNNRGKINN